MKIALIGSHVYRNRMENYRDSLEVEGHEVKIPAFDFHPELNELGICAYNRDIILWADEVHVFWDQRSMGTIFDLGMTFMAGKRFKVVYLEPKTFANMMHQYEEQSDFEKSLEDCKKCGLCREEGEA